MKFLRLAFSLLVTLALCLTLICPAFAADDDVKINKETGNNGSFSKADKLELNISTKGKLSSKKDIDYFRIETKATGDINFHFAHEGDGVYAYYWYAEVLDEKKNVLKSGNLSGKDPTDFALEGVEAGKYYLKISVASGGNPFMIGYTDADFMITATAKCLTHTELEDWVVHKEPSCSTEGERTQTCKICKSIVINEVIPFLEHEFNDWSIVKRADLFKIGQKQHTCTLCGERATKMYLTKETTLAVGVIGVVLLIIMIVVIAKARKRRRYVPVYNSSKKSSSGGSSSYSTSSSSSSSSYINDSYSSGSSYSSSSYSGSSSSSSDDDYYYTRPYDGTTTIGGTTYGVYTSDAEGYSTSPYIEDAEGYRTSVDPGMVDAPFNWLDM